MIKWNVWVNKIYQGYNCIPCYLKLEMIYLALTTFYPSTTFKKPRSIFKNIASKSNSLLAFMMRLYLSWIFNRLFFLFKTEQWSLTLRGTAFLLTFPPCHDYRITVSFPAIQESRLIIVSGEHVIVASWTEGVVSEIRLTGNFNLPVFPLLSCPGLTSPVQEATADNSMSALWGKKEGI